MLFAPLVGKVPLGHLAYLYRRLAGEKPHRFGRQVRINTFFPPAPSKAFSRFCHAVAARRRVPYSTYLAVTARCPFACEHCSSADRSTAPDRPLDDLLNLIGQVKALGGCTLGLTGGEPLLREDLPELLSAAKPELATVVFSTGRGLNAALARKLAEAGTDCVTLGVESTDAAEHDARRGSAGSFAAARAAVATLGQAGVYVALSTIATREAIRSGGLFRMYELAEQWDAGELRVLSPVATGRWRDAPDVMLSERELRDVRAFHVACNARSDGPAVASFARLESPELFGCGGGYHHLYIDVAGNVSPCDLTPLSLGNAFDQPLDQIYRTMADTFAQPRRSCLMRHLAGSLGDGELPLGPDRSRELLADLPDEPLPEGYRRLL
jgi:MoaA/NifB/PqqE/SkfB family radical SAM enzyme